ncbi:DNA ligase [Abortiporus biennis]
MMQPTPAPTTPGSSPPPRDVTPEDARSHAMAYPDPPVNRDTAPFYVLSSLFDKLQNERKPEKRRRMLDSWFNHWRQEKGLDLYPVLRLILPQKDRERAVYGLKEKYLAKTYIKLIPLGMKDPDAIRLLNWKKPSDKDKSSGDFPTVLYEVISKRSSVIQGTLTIDELNEALNQLSKQLGHSDIQAKILQRVYNRTTPEEQRWIIRIILKDMIMSVKETTVFSVFHPDAQDLYNTCSDLKKVAWELCDPNRRLNEEDKAVHLFRSFAPMLCKRPLRKIEDAVNEMQGNTFVIEEKLDGERMQLHKRGNEYYYCSRKGKDYTYLYGKHVGIGSLTPFIHGAFDPRVESIILDGEMLVWDPVSERNLPFGTLKTAALDKTKTEHNPRPCFKIFDLLYLNGQSLIRKSLKFRKRNLRACLNEVKGRMEFTVESDGKTAQDIRNKMEEIMANRGEGLVIKHPNSAYVLNGRNKDWIKVKPEYMDNMGETVDVLVVAGNYGSGRRAGGVSTLICAVLDDRRQLEDDDEEPKYSTFVRIGTGFSFADYIWIRQKPWKVWDKKNPPDFLLISKKGYDDKGDVYLEPQDSFIVKVKAAEITSSDQYAMGFTMRFPRAIAIRDDLSISDCMTATTVLGSLRAEKKRKMDEDVEVKAKKKRKTVGKVPKVLAEYKGVKLRDVEKVSDLFEGYKFLVASDPKSRTGTEEKNELIKVIHANGGKNFSMVGKHSDIIVVYGGTTTPYDIKLIMNKGVCDIIRPSWIKDSVAKGSLVPLTKKYFFHATDSRQLDPEYSMEDAEESETEDEGEEEEPEASTSVTPSTNAQVDQPMRSREPSSETEPEQLTEAEQLDPSLADWFKIDLNKETDPEKGSAGQKRYEDDSETEPEADSENEDVIPDDQGIADIDDDWLEVSPTEASERRSQTLDDNTQEDQKVPKMGEEDDAMEYDQKHIFKHLCFYLDSPDNVNKHGMTMKAKNTGDITKNFEKIAKLIVDNGGRIVDIDEPKLTHIVLDKRDTSRRIEHSKRTSKPKRRNLVVSDYIQACLDEETLLDEDEFAP